MAELKRGCPDIREHISSDTVEISADVKNLALVGEFIRTNAENAGFEEKVICALELAVDEIVSNAIIHGCEEHSEEKVVVKVDICSDVMVIMIEESGREFDPFEAEEPDIDADLEDRKIGGLGLFFVRQIMDEFYFEKGENRLKRFYMVKRIP